MSLWGEEPTHSHDASSPFSAPFLPVSLTTLSCFKCDYICSFILFRGCVVPIVTEASGVWGVGLFCSLFQPQARKGALHMANLQTLLLDR